MPLQYTRRCTLPSARICCCMAEREKLEGTCLSRGSGRHIFGRNPANGLCVALVRDGTKGHSAAIPDWAHLFWNIFDFPEQILGPFERLDLDMALVQAQANRKAGAPGRPEDAWRLHSKAAWAGNDCISEQQAQECPNALHRACKTKTAAKIELGVFCTNTQQAWSQGGKVASPSSVRAALPA